MFRKKNDDDHHTIPIFWSKIFLFLFYFILFLFFLLLRFIVKNFIVKKFIVKIYCAIIINLKIYTLYYYNPKTGKGKKKFSNLKAN